jgi:hypothetical protein
LRLYQSSEPWLNGGVVNATTIATLGNTQIRPERSVEWEGGFDADMLQDALSVGITIYRKMRYDALLQVPVAPSVYGNGGGFSPDVLFFENVGEIRNTGLELSLTTQFVHSSMVSWSAVLNLSQNHNMVVQLGPGVLPFIVGADSRIAAGYPLFGFWARPILGYFDANRDGIIEASEVRLGDSAVYMGTSEPKYLATLFTNMSLFHGAVTATVGFSYQHAFTQLNLGLRRLSGFHSAALADPSSPLSAQAAVAAAPYTDAGLLETVSVLRLNSISVAYNVPQRLARSMGAQAVSLQLQGTNLGLWTHYQGKDPNVNAFSTGNGIADTGVLPTPRTLQVSVRVAY